MLVRLDHGTRFIKHPNDRTLRARIEFCLTDSSRDVEIPQSAECQLIADEIDAALIFFWSNFVDVRRAL